MNPYQSQDNLEDRKNEQASAAIDAWEADWASLRNQLMVAVVKAGFEKKGVAAILERAAGDIIDLYNGASK